MDKNTSKKKSVRFEKSTQHLISYDEERNFQEGHDVEVITKIPKRRYKKGSFIMQTYEFDELILEKSYTGLTFKVLSALKLRYTYNNEIKHFTQKEIAEQLSTTQANVSREINKLLEDNVIFKKDGVFYFNQKYFSGSGEMD